MNTNHKMKSFILKLMAFICVFGLRNNCISALYVNSDSTSSSRSLQPIPSSNSKFDLDWLAALRQPLLSSSSPSSSSTTNLNRKYKYFLSKKEKAEGRNNINNPPSSLSHSLQKRQKVQEDADSVATFRLPQQKNNHRQIIYAKTKMNNYNNHKRSGYNNNNNYFNEMISEPAMSSNTMLRSPRGQRQYDVPQIGKYFLIKFLEENVSFTKV